MAAPARGPETLAHDPDAWGFVEGDELAPGRIALERLGGGSDYEAYLIWDDHLHALAVAKCLRPHLVDDAVALRHLARESGLVRRLAHPVVVRGFGAVLSGQRPHLVLEHLDGPTLEQTIRRFGPLAPRQVLPLAFQLASALAFLANEQVVHLDVKPRNVIMGIPPRLIDLSVARPFADATSITKPIGTDAYMAPEQSDPMRAPIGPRADVWGLGATLFHAVAGEVPFPRDADADLEEPRERFPQLSWTQGPLPKETPAALATVIGACLEFEPQDRPSAAVVALELQPLIGELKPERILGRPRPKIR